MASGEVLELLREIESDGLRNAAPPPLQRSDRVQWQGLGFQIGGVWLVAALGEVEEVLRLPRLTPLPRVKDWVLGVANVRGRLIPVLDPQRLMGIGSSVARTNWRVLVVSDQDLTVGLYVEQSLGIQHFSGEEFECAELEGLTVLQPYIVGAYRQHGQAYYLVNLRALIRDEQFMEVAQ